MRTSPDVHGVLVVDKPPGPTSHDVVAQARKVYGTRRVGHTGTLDPMATGVLVLLFGEATKLCNALCATEKLYRARVVFGYSTDSDDALGNPITQTTRIPNLRDNDRLKAVLQEERNRTQQMPPRFSAISKNGQRLYKAARSNIEVQRDPRPVRVHDLHVVDIGENHLDIELLSSKGYYVRSLARDLGDALDCPAHLGALRRISTGPFSINLAVAWPPSNVHPLMPIVQAVRLAMPSFQLTENGVHRARHGQPLSRSDFLQLPAHTADMSLMAWLFGEKLVALGQWCDEETLRVARGFCAEPAAPSNEEAPP
jgi:tRNA pseudouridine55 synthase